MSNIDVKVLIKEDCDIITTSLILDYWERDATSFRYSLDILSKKYVMKSKYIQEVVSKFSTLQIRIPCFYCQKLKQLQIANRIDFKSKLVCRVCKLKLKQKVAKPIIENVTL